MVENPPAAKTGSDGSQVNLQISPYRSKVEFEKGETATRRREFVVQLTRHARASRGALDLSFTENRLSCVAPPRSYQVRQRLWLRIKLFNSHFTTTLQQICLSWFKPGLDLRFIQLFGCVSVLCCMLLHLHSSFPRIARYLIFGNKLN